MEETEIINLIIDNRAERYVAIQDLSNKMWINGMTGMNMTNKKTQERLFQ